VRDGCKNCLHTQKSSFSALKSVCFVFCCRTWTSLTLHNMCSTPRCWKRRSSRTTLSGSRNTLNESTPTPITRICPASCIKTDLPGWATVFSMTCTFNMSIPFLTWFKTSIAFRGFLRYGTVLGDGANRAHQWFLGPKESGAPLHHHCQVRACSGYWFLHVLPSSHRE